MTSIGQPKFPKVRFLQYKCMLWSKVHPKYQTLPQEINFFPICTIHLKFIAPVLNGNLNDYRNFEGKEEKSFNRISLPNRFVNIIALFARTI